MKVYEMEIFIVNVHNVKNINNIITRDYPSITHLKDIKQKNYFSCKYSSKLGLDLLKLIYYINKENNIYIHKISTQDEEDESKRLIYLNEVPFITYKDIVKKNIIETEKFEDYSSSD